MCKECDVLVRKMEAKHAIPGDDVINDIKLSHQQFTRAKKYFSIFQKIFFFPISKKKDFLFIFIRYFEDLTRLECTIERSRLLRCDQG